MQNLLFNLLIAAALAAAPNVLWLRYSTVRVTNAAGVPLRRVSLLTPPESTLVGKIPSASARFAFLPTTFGEATFSLVYETHGVSASGCQDYVESAGYHVEVVVREDQHVQCAVELPLTSALLIQKLF